MKVVWNSKRQEDESIDKIKEQSQRQNTKSVAPQRLGEENVSRSKQTG